MAYDKIVDSTALDTALTDIADAIRTKTGKISPLTIEQMPSEIESISGGSSAPESDPREVYQGTRPAEWLRLPDYDKVENHTVYFLLKLFPNGENKVSFSLRFSGICTISAGEVSNGAFVQFCRLSTKSDDGRKSADCCSAVSSERVLADSLRWYSIP